MNILGTVEREHHQERLSRHHGHTPRVLSVLKLTPNWKYVCVAATYSKLKKVIRLNAVLSNKFRK